MLPGCRGRLLALTARTKSTLALRPSAGNRYERPMSSSPLSSAFSTSPADPLISESLRLDCSASSHQQLIDKLKANRLLTLPHVEHALRSVDRAHFIPPPPTPPTAANAASYYYRDTHQPIGSLATIAAPSAHCIALEALLPLAVPAATSLRCLDIGSGSGFLTLCLALLAGPSGRVWGVDHAEALVAAAGANVRRAGHTSLLDSGRLTFVSADGMLGLPLHQPFDVIHCGAAVDGAKAKGEVGEVAGRLLRQLRDGGVLLIPEITAAAEASGGGEAKSKWSFTFTAASQSLNLYQRLPASTAGQPSASTTPASSPPLPPFIVRSLMHCSYAPMRSQPPPADIDSLDAFRQQTEQLTVELSESERRVKQWHDQWKQEKGKGASEADRAADATLQALLHDWKAKSVQLAQRKRIEQQLQSAAQKHAGSL